tara:strand:- start:295 stop:1002 length:708 start_codon:yes stop_codon:yes gene_type:complete
MIKKFFFNKKYSIPKNFKIIKNDFKFILQILKKKKIQFNNKKIVDLGCSNGSFLYFLKKKFPNNIYHGIDSDRSLLEINKKNLFLNDIIFKKKSILNKFSKDNYDVITCLGTLNLFKNQELVLNNFLNHLNNKGILILNCYLNKNNIDINVKYKKFFENKKFLSNEIYFKSYQRMYKYFLKKKLLRFFIIPNPYPQKIKKSSDLNIYTRKIDGINVRTNDLNILYDQYLIIAQKK